MSPAGKDEQGGAGEDLAPLGEELARLLARQGLPVVRIVPITSLASPVADRAAFRVELAGGKSIKARRCKSIEAVLAQDWLSRCWSGTGFPAVLAAEGRSILLEWVDGESFSARLRGACVYEACGDLLGRLHTVAVAGDGIRSKMPASVAAWRTKILEWTWRLAENDRISSSGMRRLVSLLDAAAPTTVEIGCVHLDYSAANLILDSGDNPVAVDNETLSFAPLDYDLAVSERRWPMEDLQRAAFEHGYERHRALTGYRRARPFWHLAYVARRAALKSRRPGGEEKGALEALYALLEETGAGATGAS